MSLKKLLVLSIALALGTVACGDSAEEQLLEQILESGDSGISDVEIDNDGGEFNITVEGEDGEDISISSQSDDDGFSMTVEGEDGETMTIGGGDVPEGMETPIPSGGSVLQSFSSDTDLSVVLEYPATSFDELVSLYDATFDGPGISRSESSFTSDDGTMRSVNWISDDGSLRVSVNDCYSASSGELDGVCLNVFESGS